MAKLTDKQREFLQQPFVATVTTLREDGSPQSTVVWLDVDDGGVSFNTALGRAKPKHLERDPRASVLVVDPTDPYKWVSIDGRVEITTEGADELVDVLVGKDEYPWRNPEETRVRVRITPEHITATGLE